jgi:hypothetical protein
MFQPHIHDVLGKDKGSFYSQKIKPNACLQEQFQLLELFIAFEEL